MQARGRFISFEGGEGCGKSTQVKLLAEALRARGVDVVTTREPGGDAGAEAIRQLLVSGEPARWEPMTEMLLFLAARTQHVARTIMPAVARGVVVICDRFHDSTRVYQGIGHGLSRRYYEMLHSATLGNVVPDMTLVLDVPVELGLKRALSRGGDETRFEQMDMGFHEKVRAGFLELAQVEPERIQVVDASQPLEAVHQEIMRILLA